MIDQIAMILCVGGFGLLSFGLPRIGFAASAVGSVFWLLFAMGVNSSPLMIQSMAFLVFSAVGLAKCSQKPS